MHGYTFSTQNHKSILATVSHQNPTRSLHFHKSKWCPWDEQDPFTSINLSDIPDLDLFSLAPNFVYKCVDTMWQWHPGDPCCVSSLKSMVPQTKSSPHQNIWHQHKNLWQHQHNSGHRMITSIGFNIHYCGPTCEDWSMLVFPRILILWHQ